MPYQYRPKESSGVLVNFYCQLRHSLEAPGKRKPQLMSCLDKTGPWHCLWDGIFIDDWCWRAQPSEGGPGCIIKLDEPKPSSEPGNSIPPQFLLQFLHAILPLTLLNDGLSAVSWKKPISSPKLHLAMVFISATGKQAKTVNSYNHFRQNRAGNRGNDHE